MGIVQTDEEQSCIQDGCRERRNGQGGTGKADAGKADAGKADAGKADAGKADAGKADAGKADAEENGTGRGSEGRGQSNFELSINSDYVHEGQLTLAKVCVNAGSQSLL